MIEERRLCDLIENLNDRIALLENLQSKLIGILKEAAKANLQVAQVLEDHLKEHAGLDEHAQN